MDLENAPEVYNPSDKEVVPEFAPEALGAQSSANSASEQVRPKRQTRIYGCDTLTFILSATIGLLIVVVIGLAVGTGVEANHARQAEAKLVEHNAENQTGIFDSLDLNCSSHPSTVTGTIFKTSFYQRNFQIACNIDTPHAPLQSLFVANFADSGVNTTCAGVSFIPLWTNVTKAIMGGAPGNCYLKPGPMTENDLTAISPNIGTAVQAAFAVNITFVGGGQ